MIQVVAGISSRLVAVTSERRDATLGEVLRELGEFTCVDRCYLFSVSGDLRTMTNTHEWCAEGISAEIENLEAFPLDAAPWLGSHFRQGRVVNVASVAHDLPPEAEFERQEWEREGILSLLNVPLMRGGTLIGVLGFDSVREEKRWSAADLELLSIVGDSIASALERLEKEEELLRAKEAAEASAAAKASFLARMSHELRTPLNGVIGLASLLCTSDLDSTQRDNVETIRLSAEFLLAIIGEILDFSKLEEGMAGLEIAPLDPVSLAEDALDVVAPQANRKRLALICVPSSVPTLMGDGSGIRQVLLNLVSNALKFTDRGRVVVEVGAEPADDGYWQIAFSVQDTGIGIEPHHLEAIFSPFVQADDSTTRRFGGTGLGLAISRRLAELMGGRLRALSSPGQGSVFEFRLTLEAAPSDASPVPGLTGHALVMVRESEVRRGLAAMLRLLGLEPLTPRQVSEARAAAAVRPKDLVVFLDPSLPSSELTRLRGDLRSLRDSGVPFVSLGGPGSPSDPVLRDVDASLSWPIRRRRLRQLLASLLEQPAPSQYAAEPLASGPSAPDPHQPLRVLVAEDTPVSQKVAGALLESLGHSTEVVSNGREAVEEAGRERYDVILMDIEMPLLDGLQATREIRGSLPVERQPKIIGLTAHATRDFRAACLAAGMDGYLPKPVTVEGLAAALARLTSSSS